MNALDRRGVLTRYPRISAPLQIALCGVSLTFATPLCCAIFEQQAKISVDKIETEIRDHVRSKFGPETKVLVYNKGL